MARCKKHSIEITGFEGLKKKLNDLYIQVSFQNCDHKLKLLQPQLLTIKNAIGIMPYPVTQV